MSGSFKKDEQLQQRLNSELSRAYSEQTYQNGEAHWAACKASAIKVVENVVGFPTRRHQDWFDENDNEISVPCYDIVKKMPVA